MASTNFTTHYAIPTPLGTDLTTPMDYNEAAEAVDTALFGAVTDAANASQSAQEAISDVASISDTVTDIQSDLTQEKAKIVSLQTRMTSAENEIDDVRADSSDMITAYNEPTATSTHAYAIGDFFIYNNTLYKATAAIAIGDTIVPDTNCITTNVSSELIQINNDLNKGSVSVTADGVKTVKQLLNELYALVNLSKVTKDSKIVVEYSTGSLVYHLMKIQGTDLFYLHNMSTSVFDIVNLKLATGSNSGTYTVSGTTPTFGNSDSYVWTSGTKYELFY